MREFGMGGSQSLPFGERAEIDFKSELGSVMVLPVRAGEEPSVSTVGSDGGVAFEVTKEGNVVRVRMSHRDSFLPWGRREGPVIVRVPPALAGSIRTSAGNIQAGDLGPCELELTSSAGRVEVRGMSGRLMLRSDAGRIEASNLGPGEFVMRSSAGRISVQNARGRFQLSTSAGRIDAEGISGSVNARSDMGTVRLAITRLDAGEHEVRTQLGSVRVELARGLNVRVDGRASLGSVRIHYPSHSDAPAVLHCTTEAGSVRVHEGDYAPEPERETEAPVYTPPEPSEGSAWEMPAASEEVTTSEGRERSPDAVGVATETERILKMVAQGEISPNEADELLQALEQE